MSSTMNNMYSAIITSMVQKMKSQLEEIETMTRIMDRMNRENTSCTTPSNNDNEIDLNILMHRFAILERRLAAVEESKNIYVSQNEDDAWLGESGPLENEVIELSSTEDSAVPVVVKKAEEAAAKAEAEAKKRAEADAAEAKRRAEEEVAAAVIIAKKKAEEEAEAKRKAEEAAAAVEAKRKADEAEAKKKAKEEALAKKKAEEEAARKKAEEEARRKAEQEAEEEEVEEEEEEEEVEEEEEEDATELTEFEYKGQTYYRDEDNVVYVLSDEGEPEPVGRFNEKTGGVKMFAK